MSEHSGATPAEHAWGRLCACFLPPEVADVRAFRTEFMGALSGYSNDVLVPAVTQVIRTRKHKTFPSIGDINDACMAQFPATPQRPHIVTDDYERVDSLRSAGIAALADMPGIERVIAADAHTEGLDFYVQNGRLPDRSEWAQLRAVVERANKLMAEADSVPEAATSTWVHITKTAAAALRHKRERVAEEIAKHRMKEAAE